MLGDDVTTAFLLGILLLWIGALICLRGSLFASQVARLPATPATPASDRQAAVNGDSDIDDLSVLGISLVIVGYTIFCYALLF